MKHLLDKFDLTGDKKFFLIFDVDGTLRPDEVTALDHRYPKIDPGVARKLMELNTHERVKIIILTARSCVDIFRSNIPKNITKYCGFGKQVVENEAIRHHREEFTKAYDETVFFVDIIKDILGPQLTKDLDFLITPGDFAIYFEADKYQEQRKRIMAILEILFSHSKRWHLLDLDKELIFKDNKYAYNKGNAVWDVLEQMNLNELTHVFLFGDSMADYLAMKSLREYQKTYPQKRLKVTNISVGPDLVNEEAVDLHFESYKETLAFVEELHQKLFPE